MKQAPVRPYVITPGITMSYNRIREVASRPFDVDTAATIIYGSSGSGKSELARKVARELGWPGHPADYAARILSAGSRTSISNELACDLARRAGVMRDEDDEEYFRLLRERRDAYGSQYLWDAPAAILWDWFHVIAKQFGRPYPDPIGLLPMWGIPDTITHRCPIVIDAMVGDKPALLEVKILDALGQPNQKYRQYRSMFLITLLRKLPIVLIVDEADMLHEDSLHSVRQYCDLSRTPLVLCGTERLRTRLLSTPALRPLATRVGMRIELGTVTLPDLRKSLPGMEGDIVLEVFRQGGECFRTINILLCGLRKFQDNNPGRRITPEIVQMVAKRVLTAVAVRTAKAAPTARPDVVFTEEDLGVEIPAEALRAAAEVSPARVARAMR